MSAHLKPVLGMLGGIGSGKSMVGRYIAERYGGRVFDADAVVGRLLDRDPIARRIVERWGPAVRSPDGRIDRVKLSQIVFADDASRAELEQLLHPRVDAERQACLADWQAQAGVRLIVLDVPLLAEVGWDELCDVLIFVRAERHLRLRRLAADRGWEAEELARREKSQMPLDKKLSLAQYVVDNNGSEAECHRQIRDVVSKIL
jgi:dephospho-CoA kinase